MASHVSVSRLDNYKRLFTRARDASVTERENASRYRRYYDGKTDPDLRKRLKKAGMPTYAINRVRPGIDAIVGIVDRGQSDPRAYPRNPQDEASSEVATDSLRYICDQARWKPTKLAAFRNELIEGTCAVIVEVDENLDINPRRIRSEEFFADPYSRELDFSDANFMGVGKWQHLERVITVYPEFEAELRMSSAAGDMDREWEDRPTHVTWNDTKGKRLFVVEMYHQTSGTWFKCVFTGSLMLEEGESPYLDNKGQPCCPIEAVSAYIDDDNVRYGAVADMAGPQDEINALRRRAAHRGAFRQVQETDPIAAYANTEEVRSEAARPDGVIPPGYQIVPDDKTGIDMALLAEAKSEIERTQPNEGILGRQSADASGRSMLVRQQAGMTELAPLLGGLEDWERRVLHQCWARVRQYWKASKFIRVTDKADAIKFVQLNEPILGEPSPVFDQATGGWKMDPVTRQLALERPVVGTRNQVSQMDVDIVVDTTPDTANVQQEQFQALIELLKAGVHIPHEAIVLASSIRNKREVLEAMKTPPPPPPPGLQEKLQAETAKLTAQGELAHANAIRTMSQLPPPAPEPQAEPAYPYGQ